MLCAQEKAWKVKKYPAQKLCSYIIPLSALYDLGPLQSDPYESSTQPPGHGVSGIQTTSELLRESICHPASPENINWLTQTRLGEGIRIQ